ncbi:MAG: hypothetical protein AVDCRST_MAG38-2760 [uncultured Solirubrobacteraceae bacterium]|uniref:Uncharacterized protein n=1 Tax=uncultured Solirubrobacteraceae bacterium TaxID=1162706 RepID=A0A6J4S9L6_9ACTN|nr:MAG: hypothetical protein AVDCRST_MAG38-2760 [uncultured Solirubrobacteraceae bacterium]
MPPKQRRVESKSALNHMQRLESRSDDELEAETRYRSAAQALLGARAAEKMDANRARAHYRAAIAAARPQERLQLRRMAEASLALAERRGSDLKAAAQKLGQAPPTNRQLLALRLMGLVAPGPRSSPWLKVRALLIVLGFILAVFALGFGLVKLVALPFGGLETSLAVFWGGVLMLVVMVALILIGRRRQRGAQAKAAAARAEQLQKMRR